MFDSNSANTSVSESTSDSISASRVVSTSIFDSTFSFTPDSTFANGSSYLPKTGEKDNPLARVGGMLAAIAAKKKRKLKNSPIPKNNAGMRGMESPYEVYGGDI